jgi:hypothetical protein
VTEWSGIKRESSLKETQRSWYRSIDKMHLWIYVKSDGGLSIPLARKSRSQKSETFSKGMFCLFSNGGIWTIKFLLYRESKRSLPTQSPNNYYQRRAQTIATNAEPKRSLSTQSPNLLISMQSPNLSLSTHRGWEEKWEESGACEEACGEKK